MYARELLFLNIMHICSNKTSDTPTPPLQRGAGCSLREEKKEKKINRWERKSQRQTDKTNSRIQSIDIHFLCAAFILYN